jgi:DNA-directed RNA polymerase specialized sigma24 family protein
MAADSVSEGDWKGAAFRRTLVGIVRKRVPECDVEDIVQATLTEALSPSAPTEDAALQRWLIGVARHKIADRHRRRSRESFELPEVEVAAAPHSEADLVRWAERKLPPDGEEPQKTLEWMLREGEGEKLEAIAESEQLPAPRVRKRVSRLRSHLRAQWRKEVALLAALGIVAAIVWIVHRDRAPIAREPVSPIPTETPETPEERAKRLREDALAACEKGAWASCIDGLDRAKEVDPSGDGDLRVQRARAAASAAIPPPLPSSVPTPAPAPTSAPRLAPTTTPSDSAPAPTLPVPAKRNRPSKVPSSGSSL